MTDADLRCARELMIPIGKYPHVPAGITIAEAIATFLDRAHDIEIADGRKSLPRSLLVIGDNHELLGLLRRRDIMRGLEPGFLRAADSDPDAGIFKVRHDPALAEFSFDHMLGPMKARADHEIDDLVQPIRVTVGRDDHLFKIIDAMVSANVSLVPVIEKGSVLGAIRTVDVLEEVSRLIQ
jgi:hypothetical protein